MKNKGFTLLELSIVLVVIALIAGAILVGQSVVRSSEMKEVLADYDRYVKAIKEFQDKYQALPGDMKNATDIWGADTGCTNTPTNNIPKTATCNGNGNGLIGASGISAGIINTYSYEWFRAWQQLSNAGLIEGKYTGVYADGGTTAKATTGLNIPKAKMRNDAGWLLFYLIQISSGIFETAFWADNYGHVLLLGKDTADITSDPAFTPDEALSIDQKIDDGKPGTGTIRGLRTATLPNCTINDTSKDAATYNAAYTGGNACSILFILGF